MSEAEIKALFQSKGGPLPDEVYQHYKGGIYLVKAIALDEATLEPMVVYQTYGDRTTWVRPLSSFLAPAKVNGETVPRFVRYL